MLPALLVHLFTASGAILALLATLAIFGADYRAAFFWLGLATIVDASDGWLARTFQVRARLPRVSGETLDNIVDYLTFVFVPVVLLLVSRRSSVQAAVVVLLASAYGFSHTAAKTDDHFFTGFPSYWNIVAFYLFVGSAPRALNDGVLLLLSALVFVRIGYIYPTRTPVLRTVTLVLGLLWGALMFVLIWQLPDVSRPLLGASLLFPAYYGVLSVILHRRRV